MFLSGFDRSMLHELLEVEESKLCDGLCDQRCLRGKETSLFDEEVKDMQVRDQWN